VVVVVTVMLLARKQVEVLKQLQHPHIVCMYEAFLQGGSLNIIMEYADAGDLAQVGTSPGTETSPFIFLV